MTGGIGAGKTETLRAFERRGAAVLSSDEIVHRLLREDQDVRSAVVARFGPGILGEGGEIDRGRLADLVFSSPEDLRWLENLLHPRVLETYGRWREALAAREDAPALCAAEVPLLYEAGAEGLFDAVVVVTAPPDVRSVRLTRSVEEREKRLLPEEEKAARADFAYLNDGTLEDLDAFVACVAAALTRGSPARSRG